MEFPESKLVAEIIEQEGRWKLPSVVKTIAVWSPSGGTGKTSIAAALACQLRHIANLPRVSKSCEGAPKVLFVSFSEFDDASVQEIGYESAMSRKSEHDNANFLALEEAMEDASSIEWNELSQYLAINKSNGVYSLPFPTTRTMIEEKQVPTDDMYRKVLAAISPHFQFIVLDLPSIFYRDRSGLVQYAFSTSDAICFVAEPDTRAYMGIYHLFDGMRGHSGRLPLNPGKCLLVINKYVDAENPWMPFRPLGQMDPEKMVRSMSRYFSRYAIIPFAEPAAYGNLLSRNDSKCLQSVGGMTDQVLSILSA